MSKHNVSAFPNDGTWANGIPEPGLTIRDYFAAKALAAMIGNRDKDASSRGRGGLTKFPKYAYEWADAMLKAREQTP